jgi:hypothetical protein
MPNVRSFGIQHLNRLRARRHRRPKCAIATVTETSAITPPF